MANGLIPQYRSIRLRVFAEVPVTFACLSGAESTSSMALSVVHLGQLGRGSADKFQRKSLVRSCVLFELPQLLPGRWCEQSSLSSPPPGEGISLFYLLRIPRLEAATLDEI